MLIRLSRLGASVSVKLQGGSSMPATVVARRMQRNVCVQYKLLFKDEDSMWNWLTEHKGNLMSNFKVVFEISLSVAKSVIFAAIGVRHCLIVF